MPNYIEIKTLETHPSQENPSWRAILDRMMINQYVMTDKEGIKSIQTIAHRYFHKPGTKRFKSTTKGQPAGKVKIWREA